MAAEKCALEIEIDHFVPTLFGQLQNLQTLNQRSGIVNQDIDWPEFSDGLFDQRLHLARSRNVCLNDDGAASATNYFCARRFSSRFVAMKIDGYSRTIRGQGLGGGAAYSR